MYNELSLTSNTKLKATYLLCRTKSNLITTISLGKKDCCNQATQSKRQ